MERPSGENCGVRQRISSFSGVRDFFSPVFTSTSHRNVRVAPAGTLMTSSCRSSGDQSAIDHPPCISTIRRVVDGSSGSMTYRSRSRPFRWVESNARSPPWFDHTFDRYFDLPSVSSVLCLVLTSYRKNWIASAAPPLASFPRSRYEPSGAYETEVVADSPSGKKVICWRSIPGPATEWNCGTLPNVVEIRSSRRDGCHPANSARRNPAYGASAAAYDAGIGGRPSAFTLSGTGRNSLEGRD